MNDHLNYITEFHIGSKMGFCPSAKHLPAEHEMTSGLRINQCVYETRVYTHVHMRAFRKQFLLLT